MLTILLFTLLQSAPANIPADLAEELKSIKLEEKAIQEQYELITAEQARLDEKEARINDANDLYERGLKTYMSERASWQIDFNAWTAEVSRNREPALALKRLVDDFNLRCVGELEIPVWNACEAEKSTLRPQIAAMEALEARLEAWDARLLAKNDALKRQQGTLEQIEDNLLSDQSELVNKTDALLDNLRKLEGRINSLDARRTKALMQLSDAKAISADCAEIAKRITTESCKGKGDPSDPANWNTPCELAARCLSKAFDGAR